MNIKGKKILVIGGTGFIGKWLIDELNSHEAVTYSMSSTKSVNAHYSIVSDLLNDAELDLTFSQGFDYVFHLAGYNGGIKFNQDQPAAIFMANTLMAMNLITVCCFTNVQKVVSTVTSCAYPAEEYFDEDYEVYGWRPTEVMKEQNYLDGYPHETVACHGYAKRNLLLASYYANKQYGLNAVCVCPTTVYGPGDNFDPNRSKVMGGLIGKFVKAKQENDSSVTLWGTGAAQREFIYVEDAVKYIYLSLLKYDDCSMPLNIGSGQEIPIKELAEKVAKAVKYNGRIEWDTTKPDGQLRKCLDRTRQEKILGKIKLTPLDEGIAKTVEWYLKEKLYEVGSVS